MVEAAQRQSRPPDWATTPAHSQYFFTPLGTYLRFGSCTLIHFKHGLHLFTRRRLKIVVARETRDPKVAGASRRRDHGVRAAYRTIRLSLEVYLKTKPSATFYPIPKATYKVKSGHRGTGSMSTRPTYRTDHFMDGMVFFRLKIEADATH